MDATTVGGLIAGGAAVIGTVAAYLGKRAENAVTRFNSVTDQVQEDNATLRAQLAAAQAELVELHKQRHEDLVEMARLQVTIIRLEAERDTPRDPD